MTNCAIVVATAAEDRRNIAQLIKPTELFEQVHFCSSVQEARFLLEHGHIDILCCDAYNPGNNSTRMNSGLIKLASEYDKQLVFFSSFEPDELTMLGILPKESHCLSYETGSSTVLSLLKSRLSDEPAVVSERSRENKLIDQNSGVYNRFYFDAFLDQELSRSKLTGRPFSLLLIEPKHSQSEQTGNGSGGVLPSIAMNIKNQIRTSDLLCRIETSRLALLLPETTSFNAKRVIQRIHDKIEELAKEFAFDLKIGMASPALNNQYNRHGLLRAAEATL